MGLPEIVERIQKTLDKKDAVREETLRTTRDIIRLCGSAIKRMHSGDLEGAGKLLERVYSLMEELSKLRAEHPDIYYTGYVQTANQEYVEASLLWAYLSGKEMPSPDKLKVPAGDYALGMADFVGELRRVFLNLLIEEKIERARETYRLMEEIYAALMTLDYPKGLLNIKVKQDQVRKTVEKTLEDLTRAELNLRLRRRLEDVLSSFKKKENYP